MGFDEILARDYPDLDELALDRVKSGRSLVPKAAVYRCGTREKTRLVLMRAMGIYSQLTGGGQLTILGGEKTLLQSQQRRRKRKGSKQK